MKGTAFPQEEERQCRYCLSGPGDSGDDMIAPCGCTGGQHWVHKSCLRHWQSVVLASQPAHLPPEADDVRAARCNVCLQRFSLEPPSRHEVLTREVGTELADLVSLGCLISASARLSFDLEEALSSSARTRRSVIDFVHWCRSVYLLHRIAPRQIVLAVPDEASRAAAMELVDQDGLLFLHGRRYRLLPKDLGPALRLTAPAPPPPPPPLEPPPPPEEGPPPLQSSDDSEAAPPLAAAPQPPLPLEPPSPQENVPPPPPIPEGVEPGIHLIRREALSVPEGRIVDVMAALTQAKGYLPARLRLEAVAGDFAEDTLLAVNMSRPLAEADLSDESGEALQEAVGNAIKEVVAKVGPESTAAITEMAKLLPIQHFLGGPCDQTRCCLILSCTRSESGKQPLPLGRENDPLVAFGIRSSTDLQNALTTALQASWEEAEPADPPTKRRRIEGAASSSTPGGRVDKCTQTGEIGRGPQGCTTSQESGAATSSPFLLLAFWGEARWSRTQLLAEVARGDWGLCPSSVDDLRQAGQVMGRVAPSDFWRQLTGADNPTGLTSAGSPSSTESHSRPRPRYAVPRSVLGAL